MAVFSSLKSSFILLNFFIGRKLGYLLFKNKKIQLMFHSCIITMQRIYLLLTPAHHYNKSLYTFGLQLSFFTLIE
jgi:hypothetical protein